MSFIAFTLCFAIAIVAAVTLVLHGHPWFALLILVLVSLIKYEGEKK